MTVGELIQELFDVYGITINMEGDTSTKNSKRDRTIKFINSVESVTLKEIHEDFNKVLKNV